MIYRGPHEYSETCVKANSNLYLDSLILNTCHGKMPCHADISKFQAGDEDHREFIAQLKANTNVPATDKLHTDCVVDLSVNNAAKPSVKPELKTEQKFSVVMPKPRNVTNRNYQRSLNLLLKAKKELATKTKCREQADKITSIIQAGVNPAQVAACTRSNKMMPIQCSMCSANC